MPNQTRPTNIQPMQGFSLIELMIVISIVIILSIFSISGLKIFWQKSQAEVLSSQLINAIYLARNEALLRQEAIFLCGSDDQINCADHWQTGYLIRTANQVLYHFQNVSKQGLLHWRSFPAGRQQLIFSKKQSVQNGTFWFCLPGVAKPAWAIMLNKAQRVHLAHPNAQGEVRDSKGVELQC